LWVAVTAGSNYDHSIVISDPAGKRVAATLALVALLLLAPVGTAAAAGPRLAVDGGADQHAISPDIYGLNFADEALATQLDLPVDRWGGNTTDTYNWRLGASNTGNDWYFENIPDCWNADQGWCANGRVFGYRQFIAKDRRAGARTLLTLPMMGHVARDARLGHPFTCGYPASIFPSQDSFDPYDANCGNGRQSGVALASDPRRDGIPSDASFDSAWIDYLTAHYGSAASGGVQLYELGNEPALWNSTHRDMHPAAETYDELWSKSRALAAAVKAADPTADVLGFSEWGWPNYFCSAADHIENGCFASSPDRAAHGGVPLVEWFLRRMRAYEGSTGTRILDYLDLHYYRQCGDTTDVTRSLWDRTYTDPSWIGQKIRLIPRMKQWIADDYPGTQTALSEYNLSIPGQPVTNVLIEADTLGIFAREGLDLATFWRLGADGNLIDDAFRIYRSYDGHHSRFGDTWVRSTSADQAKLAVYGARRSSDGAYTILVINKTAGALTSDLSLSAISPTGAARVYRWAGSGIQHLANQPVGGGGFTTTYPASSMTLFAIPAS
jgi:hypothetical protein